VESKDVKKECYILLGMYTPLVRVWYFGYMISFPFFRTLTKPNKLLQTKKEIRRKISSGIEEREAYGLYAKKFEWCQFDLMNVFHNTGSIIWAFPYAIFFEEVLILFVLFCFILNKNYYKIFLRCFYFLNYIPI